MGAMNSSQIEIKCLANGMGPYMGSQRVTASPVREPTAGDGLHRGRKLGQCRFATPKGKSVLFFKV